MDTHVITICTAILLGCIAVISNALAYFMTEVWPKPIPVKPFNCWGCLSFWFTLAFGIVAAHGVPPHFQQAETRVVAGCGIAGVSVLLGLLNYLWVKLKYQVYE